MGTQYRAIDTARASLLIDHDFNERILRGLKSRVKIDAVRTRAVGLAHKPDPGLLSWAAGQFTICKQCPRFANRAKSAERLFLLRGGTRNNVQLLLLVVCRSLLKPGTTQQDGAAVSSTDGAVNTRC